MDVLTSYPYAVLDPLVVAGRPVATVPAGTLAGTFVQLYARPESGVPSWI